MKKPAGIGAFIVLLVALVYYRQNSYWRSVQYLFDGEFPLRDGCLNTVPVMRINPVPDCADVDPEMEPCIVRNAVSKEALDLFFQHAENEEFVVASYDGDIQSTNRVLGNPLNQALEALRGKPVHCTFDQLIRGADGCAGTYDTFRSLNYTHYEVLNNTEIDLNDITRADIFLGNLVEDSITASFHSNSFERSTTLQLLGEKVWMMMSPDEFEDIIGAYPIGAYNAAYNLCTEDLAKLTTLQAVHTKPGDKMSFPKAWPHNIYTFAGPNVMISFRSDAIALQKRDLLAMAMTVLLTDKAYEMSDHLNYCAMMNNTVPTSYGHGRPGKPHFSFEPMKSLDLRCASAFGFLNRETAAYKAAASERVSRDRDVDAKIWSQVKLFVQMG